MQYNLVFSTDNNYIPYLFVLCQSIVDNIEQIESNSQDELVFNVLIDDSVDLNDTKTKAQSFTERNQGCGISFNFNWILVDINIFNGCQPMIRDGKTSFSTYYRLIIGTILPEDIEHVAYLDLDILVLDDIRKLFNQYSLKDKLLGAVVDPWISESIYNEFRPFIQEKYDSSLMYAVSKDNKHQIITVPKQRYFNAGVLLINLINWRKQKITERCLDLVKSVRVRSHDQDILNIACEGQVELLNISWNTQPQMFYFLYNKDTNKYDIPSELNKDSRLLTELPNADEFEQALAKPHLIHFLNNKPWQNSQGCYLFFNSSASDCAKVTFYKNQWRAVAHKISEFPNILPKNMDLIPFTDIYLKQQTERIDKCILKLQQQQKKYKKITVFGLSVLLLMNIVTFTLLLLK